MTPHCSPRWPTLHFPVNEFNGLRFDLHELLHVIAGGWQCSSCACRRTTDSFGVSFLKFTQRLILRSQVLFLFLLCVLFCSTPPGWFSFSSWIFCARKRKPFPTYTVKKSRQFAPHYSYPRHRSCTTGFIWRLGLYEMPKMEFWHNLENKATIKWILVWVFPDISVD